MKTTTAILLLIGLLTVCQAFDKDTYKQSMSVTHLSQNKYHYPRTPQSCTSDIANSEISEVFGWYWDGQICQPCDHLYCKCSSSNACSSCKDGFKLLRNMKGGDWSTCVKCPTLGQTSGNLNNKETLYAFDSKIHNTYSEESHLQWPEVKECEIFSKLSQSEKWALSKQSSGYGTSLGNFNLWDKALRSTECGDDRLDQGIKFQHYGSICWYIIGCDTYTKWGKCQVCLPGWFKTDNQYCTKCRNSIGTYNNYEVPTLLANQQANKGCAICSTEYQCTQCAEGYYLVSPYLYQNYVLEKENYESKDFDRTNGSTNDVLQKNVLDDASWCVPCPSGCSCDEPFFKENKVHFKKVTELAGFYKKTEEECIACSNETTNGSTAKYCTNCSYINQQFKCTQCQEYVESQSSTLHKIRYTVYFESQCLLCPQNCRECEILGNDKTNISCKQTKCFNGFREIKDSKTGMITCTRCDYKNGVARCKTGSTNDIEIPTQCDTDQTGNTGYDVTTFSMGTIKLSPYPRMNMNPPSEKDYFLVGKESQNTLKCILNTKKCKTMNEDGTCSKCYNGQGLVNGECKSISNCVRTDSSGACVECVENYNLLNGACTSCGNNKIGTDCSTCIEGYRKNTANNCEQCNILNCGKCDSDRRDCETCKPGYFVWKGEENPELNQNIVCETCEYGCLQCQNRKVCTQCAETMYLHAGTCHEKTDNCAEWEGSTNKCSICNYGYRMTLIGEDRFCLECFAPELGVIHCPTNCQDAQCYYSTINNDNLDSSVPSDDNEEEEKVVEEEEATA